MSRIRTNCTHSAINYCCKPFRCQIHRLLHRRRPHRSICQFHLCRHRSQLIRHREPSNYLTGSSTHTISEENQLTVEKFIDQIRRDLLSSLHGTSRKIPSLWHAIILASALKNANSLRDLNEAVQLTAQPIERVCQSKFANFDFLMNAKQKFWDPIINIWSVIPEAMKELAAKRHLPIKNIDEVSRDSTLFQRVQHKMDGLLTIQRAQKLLGKHVTFIRTKYLVIVADDDQWLPTLSNLGKGIFTRKISQLKTCYPTADLKEVLVIRGTTQQNLIEYWANTMAERFMVTVVDKKEPLHTSTKFKTMHCQTPYEVTRKVSWMPRKNLMLEAMP